MGIVLEKVRHVPGRAPRNWIYRVQCSTCGRVYQTTANMAQIRRQKGCIACFRTFEVGMLDERSIF